MTLRATLFRYRKDPRVIVTVPLLILAATSLIYYAVQKAKELSPEALSSQMLLFVLANINVLLIFGILFVLLRGIVKLVLDRQRGIIGSRFRTKLAITWVATSLIPVLILFFFASDLLRTSIDRWFNTPVSRILTNGEAIAQMSEDQSAAMAAAAAREIAASDPAQLDAALSHVQQFHSVDMVGLYRDGALVRVVANPRAPIHEASEPPKKFFDDVATSGHATKIDVVATGKWIRSATRVGNTPYVAVAGVFIPAAMSRLIDESIVMHKNFEQLNAQRPTLKASQTSLFLAVTLAILFGTLWTSIYASRRITIPIKALAEATGRLAEGGYGHRVAVAATDEVGRLIESFNDMSTQLDQQRQALTQTNRYLSTVLDSVSAGILAFTDTFELLSVNHAALQMLQIEQPRSGANLADVLMGDLTPLFDTLRELTARGARAREVTLIRGGELRYLEVSVARLSGGGDEGWVVAVEDSTSLVQAQKLAAWNEAARRIAHEIKNPLTPIQLSAERIARKFRNNDADTPQAIEEGTKTIVSEVGQLKRMVDEFARFARMPAVHLRHAQLAEILQQAAGLYRDVKPGVSVSVTVEPDIEILVDPEQIRRAVGNLLKNAVEATESGEVRVSARRAPHRVVIEVADPGRGVPDADKEKLFLPYFSTKGRGTGLGLAIVHRIVNDHDGRISVHDNHPRGTRFEIELPA
ncbi:MAG: two-component system, NtrC family, nitrogen regulation sensor histidine kinase NtrY [Thermoanaerobaculia bacterium]|jgi:two-component system nitrogen regulation sensor histidine kinase NtrY|nr:two-component system, NtrC family, nitrogen regulation sensor histidine kinase NtrY [Thermoanaerobaculia bacterium]